MKPVLNFIKKYCCSPAILIPAVIFSINILIGISFAQYGDFTYLFGDIWQVIKSLLLVAIYTLLFSFLLTKMFCRAEKIRCKGSGLSSQKVFWVSLILLVLCYTPYLYAHYPGSINSDSSHQLASFFGYIPNTNHYPVFSTWLMGMCMKVGIKLQSQNLGIFIYILMQTIALAFVFANTLRVMIKWNLPRLSIIAVGIYYGVFPMWGGYAQFMIKDTLYAAVVVLFTTLFLEALLPAAPMSYDTAAPSDSDTPSSSTSEAAALTSVTSSPKQIFSLIHKLPLLLLTIVGILTILLRNNGVYVVIPSLAAGALVAAKDSFRKHWWIALAVSAVFCYLWNNQFLPAMGIPEGSVKEALSVPFQQTARYIREYGDEVTPEEREAIDAILAYDRIGVDYVDFGADPVKNTYKHPADEVPKIANYFKHWFLMFLKHPGVYFEATVANSYYYYCADINGSFEPIFLNYIFYDENTGFFQVEQSQETAVLRQKIYDYATGFQKLPLLGLLFSQGFYTYVLLGMIGLLCYLKKYRHIVGLLPGMISILVCVASPVNGSYRYFLPVIACTCIYLAYCVKCRNLSE